MKPDINLDVPDEEAVSRATDDIDRQFLGAYRLVDAAHQALAEWAEQHGVNRERISWVIEAEASPSQCRLPQRDCECLQVCRLSLNWLALAVHL